MKYKLFRELRNDLKATEIALEFMKKRPITTIELAEEMGIRRSTASQYLNTLYRNGQVEKVFYKNEMYYGLKI